MNPLQYPIIAAFIVLLLFTVILALQQRRREEPLLIVLLVLLFMLPRAGIFVPQVNLPLPLTHVLAAMLILIWAFHRPQRHNPPALRYFFMVYGITACWGLAWGLATGGNLVVALLETSFYLFSIGVFFYAAETFTQRRHFHLFIKGLLIAVVCVSLYGIAQHFWGASLLVNRLTYNSAGTLAQSYLQDGVASRRVLSSYGDPNVLASQLVVFIAIAAAVAIGPRIAPRSRLAWLAALLLAGLCLYYTRSRAGYLCAGLAVMVVLLWRGRMAALLLPTLALAALAAVIVLRVDVLLTNLIPPDDIRWQFGNWAWRFIRGVPLGCGFGNSIQLQSPHALEAFNIVSTANVWTGFNSMWLDLLSRLGLPGVIAFALLLTALFGAIARQARAVAQPLAKAVIVGALIGCAAQCLIWIVNNTYMLPGGGVNFWFTMGMVYAGARACAGPVAVAVVPTPEAWTEATPVFLAPQH